MSNWALTNAAAPVFLGSGSPNGVSILLTSPTTTTPSAWVEVSAALPFEVAALHLIARAPYEQRHLIDLAIGPTGSEVIVAQFPVLCRGNRNNASGPNFHYPPVALPIALPSGVRLSARITCAQGNANTVHLTVQAQPASPLHPVGFSLTSLQGLDSSLFLTTVTAFGDNYGSWVQLVGSTPWPVRAFMLLSNTGYSAGVAAAGGRTQFEVGVGASGSESPLYTLNSGVVFADIPGFTYSPIVYCSLPVGARLAARCRVEGGIWENSAGLLLFG